LRSRREPSVDQDCVALLKARVDTSAPRVDCVELDSIHERVLIDRPGVRGASTQRLAVALSGASHVRCGDRGEWDKLDGIDVNLARTNPVAATRFDPRLPPQPDRERDISRQNVIAQFTAELHRRDGTGLPTARPRAPVALRKSANLTPVDGKRKPRAEDAPETSAS
jgi:hypothetical protein